MDIHSITIGVPVSDLSVAIDWYRRVLTLPAPDLEPAEGVVEFHLGKTWLQLGEESTKRSGAEVAIRFGVGDAAAERERLKECGIGVGALQHVPEAIDYFDFRDPDGNLLSFYSEI